HTRSKRDWSSDVCSSDLYSNATRDTSIGYVFYTDNEIDVRLQDVARPRNYIRTSNNVSPIEKTVFDLSQTREGGAPTGSMAYARSEERRVGKEGRTRRER